SPHLFGGLILAPRFALRCASRLNVSALRGCPIIRESSMWSKRSRRPAPPLSLVLLEDRTLPASTITVAAGANGSGSLDAFLFDATPGVVATADGGGSPGTLSTGALTAVGAGTSISVTALNGISFADLGGTVALQTGAGKSVTFD